MALAGIDIGGTNTKLAVVDRRGEIVARDSIGTRPETGCAALFARIVPRLTELAGRRRITAAGVGCAGLVDPRRGRVHDSPNLPGWAGTSILRVARRALGVPVSLDNDANAAAYGEYCRGAGRGARVFVCITLGTGVGGAILHNGRILRGAGNYAGEIGHMTVHAAGPRCRCGNRGCLEAYLGADALVRHARRLWRRDRRRGAALGDVTPERIGEAARRGDPSARAVFAAAGEWLGIAVASLVNVLNPDVIAVAGGVAGALGLMRPKMQEEIVKRAFAPSVEGLRIARATLGAYAAALGAALIARDSKATGAGD